MFVIVSFVLFYILFYRKGKNNESGRYPSRGGRAFPAQERSNPVE